MSEAWLACVVEGHGEESAVPVLVRKIAATIDPGLYLHVPTFRVRRGRIGAAYPDIENAVARLRSLCGSPSACLALFDADDDDRSGLEASLRSRLEALLGMVGVPCAAIVAQHESENWFLAAAESLRGVRGLPTELEPPPDPEAIQGAKQWLSRRMEGGRKYGETTDQAALTDRFDLAMARTRSPSFAFCFSEVERLLRALLPPPEG